MKKLLSCLLAITMIVTLLPGYVMASDAASTTAETAAATNKWLGMTYTLSDADKDGTKETLTLSGTQTTGVESQYSNRTKSNYYTKAPYYQKSKITKVVVNAVLIDASILFYDCDNLKSVTFGSKFNSAKVKDMGEMFFGCKNITSLNVSKFNTTKVTNMGGMFCECTGLTTLDLSNFNTSNVTFMGSMFSGCKNLKSLEISNFNTARVTDMSSMFYDCSSLETLDVSNFNTINVTEMYYMFFKCAVLVTLDVSNFNTANVKDMTGMFGWCYDLENIDVSNFNTANVKNMSFMFSGCKEVKNIDVSNFDTSNVSKMECMFLGCQSLKSLDVSGFDTANVILMEEMFDEDSGLNSLDVSNFDTSKVKNMSRMFRGCSNLLTLDVSNFNTSNVSNMEGMFYCCSNLTSLNISKLDTSNVSDMGMMFYGCKKLSVIDVGNFNTAKVTSMRYMFEGCSSIKQLDVSKFDTSKVANMKGMFSSCINLIVLDTSGFDTAKVTDMSYMFYACKSIESLDTSKFDTSKVANMKGMFFQCLKLASLDVSKFNTSNVENMSDMFCICEAIKKLDLSNFDVSNAEYYNEMLIGCCSLHYLKTPVKTGVDKISLPTTFYDLEEINKKVGTTTYTEIPANATESISLVTLKHSVSTGVTTATCTEAGEITGNCDICGGIATTSKEALGHDYGAPIYTWSDDGKSCTAQKTCQRDNKHVEEESAVITSQVKVEATGTAKGITTYTATFTNPAFTTQTKDVADIPVKEASVVKTNGENFSTISDEETSLIFDTNIDNREDELSPFSCMQLKLTTKLSKGKTKATLKWKSVEGADGYIIYSAKCGKSLSKVDTVDASKTSWSQSKLKKNTYYKYLVVAYKGDSVLCTSKTVHGIAGSKKYSNPVKIKGLKKSLTVKVGKSSKLKGKVTCEKKKKIQKHVAILRYESADTSIATVSKKGKITGVSKGKTVIYAYAQNGLCKKIKVTVK